MDTKIIIKEEPYFSDVYLENVREDSSEYHKKNIKTEIKEEPCSPDSSLQDMNVVLPNDKLNKVKSENITTSSDREMDIQTKVEEVIVPHAPNGSAHFLSVKADIKEEQWWLDRNSTEAPSLSYEIKDEKDVDLVSAESAREQASRSTKSLVSNEELHKETNNKGSDVTEVLSLIKMDNTSSDKKHKDIPKKNKPVVAKDNKCDICQTRFTCPAHLKLHKLIHEGIRPHKCETCEKSFTRLSDLKTHNLIHEGKRPHQCDICERRFTRLRDLNTHKWTHNGKKPYKCEICGKGFTRGSDLKIHKLYHEGKKPHVCQICEKGFIWPSNLRVHKLIHESKKPHKCETCGKSFSLLSGVKKHKLVHESNKPHKCDTCQKDFTHLSSLKRHKLTHESIRPCK